ncbi:Alpha/Beta hydrolase protein [Zychaea mexicana]|uniref:Alpha/Beta hydrolase protein n=1 Tax=Zychaea mexicana TaxID=64656 RepID=UPI0022FDBB1D|nr:Alpha/Beta hydrolase protein [Zychaea mexicana]KAI9495293.1 Alpha/Beta hydrolase protein [Zychaea mexicana]
MRTLGNSIRRVPPAAAVKILRQGFVLPTPAARVLFKDILKPEKWHRKWIYKVRWNQAWWGGWIGENISKLDHDGMMNRVARADIIFFHVHGGGFRIGKYNMFMDTYIQLLRVLKVKFNVDALIMSVEHRLSPEYRYPSATEDVVHAYDHLINTLHVDPSRVIAMGGSTGAALILEMLFITHDPSMFEIQADSIEGGSAEAIAPELPRPASLIISSPLVTEQTTSESWRTNTKYDYISQITAKKIIDEYFEERSPDAPPEACLLGLADMQTGYNAFLPQTLMFVGNKEVLRDDALDFAHKAEQDGVPWETIVEECCHDFFFVREVVKDKKVLERADEIFADFCYRTVIGPRHAEERSYRRASEGLAAVPEEQHDTESYVDGSSSEDEFHEALTMSVDSNQSGTTAVSEESSKVSTVSSTNTSSTKKKSMTIYV